jgi:hypothetical protein
MRPTTQTSTRERQLQKLLYLFLRPCRFRQPSRPHASFEKYLGYVVAAFEVRGYRPRDEDVYVIYGQPGRMLTRFALDEDRTLFLFVFATNVNSPKR